MSIKNIIFSLKTNHQANTATYGYADAQPYQMSSYFVADVEYTDCYIEYLDLGISNKNGYGVGDNISIPIPSNLLITSNLTIQLTGNVITSNSAPLDVGKYAYATYTLNTKTYHRFVLIGTQNTIFPILPAGVSISLNKTNANMQWKLLDAPSFKIGYGGVIKDVKIRAIESIN